MRTDAGSAPRHPGSNRYTRTQRDDGDQETGRSWIPAVRLVHTAIFGMVSIRILCVFASGVRGRPTLWAGPAVMVVLTAIVMSVTN
jgi:hypothetical protein